MVVFPLLSSPKHSTLTSFFLRPSHPDSLSSSPIRPSQNNTIYKVNASAQRWSEHGNIKSSRFAHSLETMIIDREVNSVFPFAEERITVWDAAWASQLVTGNPIRVLSFVHHPVTWPWSMEPPGPPTWCIWFIPFTPWLSKGPPKALGPFEHSDSNALLCSLTVSQPVCFTARHL